MFVFATSSGSLRFISNTFEFEIENPLDYSDITAVRATCVFGIVVTLTASSVYVWDCLRPMEGKKSPRFHKLVIPSKPKCISTNGDGVCYIGLENGKIFSLNILQCGTAMPIARFAASYLIDIDGPVSCMQIFKHLLICGTSEGSVKILNLDSRKIVCTVKAPKSGLSVTSANPLFKATVSADIPSMAVTYDGKMFAFTSENAINFQITSCSAKSVFTTSVSDPHVSPLIVHTQNNRLVRMDGPNWSHQMDVFEDEDVECLSLKPDSSDPCAFIVLTREGSVSRFKQFKITTGLGPLVSVPYNSVGSLSLADFGRIPVKCISIPKTDKNISKFIRFLVGEAPEEWNGGLYEGFIAAAFNSPPEIAFCIYSQTSAKVMRRVPVSIPSLSMITCFDFSSASTTKWMLSLGMSSGQVGQMDFLLNFTDSRVEIKNLNLIPAIEGVHAGAKIVSLDTSLFGNNILTSVDTNGMISFVRLDKDFSGSPAFVAIGGESGACFSDPLRNGAYICMQDGVIERVKVPRLKKDGSEDLYDSEIWSLETVAGSVPLNGSFKAFFIEEGVAVRESGIILIRFSSSGEIQVKKSVELKPEFGESIIQAIMHKAGGQSYVVVLTNSHVVVYESSQGNPVFNRSLDAGTNPPCLLSGSCHVFRWAESLTSLLFQDRSKTLNSVENIMFKAQEQLGFPAIKGPPLLSPDKATPSLSEKEGFMKKLFKKEKDADKYKPTQAHVDEARAQLRKNLEAMEKLQDDADEMQNASADFLEQAKRLNEHFSGKKSSSSSKKEKKKFFGLF